MNIRIDSKEGFGKTTKVLNNKQRDKLATLVVLLSNNPYDPKLHTKSLSGKLNGLYSFRISKDLRVLFKFSSSTEIVLLEVGNRKNIYK